MDEDEVERSIARRVRQRHQELLAFIPPPPRFNHGSAGKPEPTTAGLVGLASRITFRTAGYMSALAVSLIIALVLVSMRTGGFGQSAGLSGQPVRVLPRALALFDPQHLIVVGSSADNPGHGAIATSKDGGLSWSSRNLDSPSLNGVAARGSTVIVTADCVTATGPDCVWRSSDGGASFVSLPGVPRLVRPALADERTGWMMTPQVRGQGTTLWDTYDAGNTWGQTTPECDLAAGINSTVSLSFPSVNEGWTACVGTYSDGLETRAIVRSSATGSTRETMAEVGGSAATGSLPGEGELQGVSMRADGSGWLWTTNQFWVTKDAGKTWTQVAASSGPQGGGQIVAAVAAGPAGGFAIVGSDSAAAMSVTHDDGASWSPVSSFPAAALPSH
jgi:photosystem II stability/assembly factor-like uncharacterized protein